MQRYRSWRTVKGAIAIVLAMVLGPINYSYADNERFVMISHAPDANFWWNSVKNSIKHAEEDFNVTIDYRNPPNGDLSDMARLIEQAAARDYAGVISSIADLSVLKRAMEKVTAKNIPLITINSGTQAESEEIGAIMHIGQPEYGAGKAAGERAKADGIQSFVCVNHYATNVSSFERCRGFAEAIGVDYRQATLDTGGVDPTAIESKVSAYLRNHSDTQAVLALGPDSSSPSLRALQKMGLTGNIWFATFDLSEEVAQGIAAGTVQFAIDQQPYLQPYLQGYIPVAVLAIMLQNNTTDLAEIQVALQANSKFQARLNEYGLAPIYGERHISSGPGFVTRDNLDKVLQYAGQYR